MSEEFRNLQSRLNAYVWEFDTRRMQRGHRFIVRSMRILYVIVRDFMACHLNLHAMGLVYTSLLSLVPALAVSFSVLKAFGVHNQVKPLLFDFLRPLGPKGSELATNVIGFVENVKVGVLGTIGLGLLIYTVVSLLQKIEGAFNHVWRIDGLRSVGQRFSNYLSVILIGPILVVGALGITASVMNTRLVQKLVAIEPFGILMVGAGKLVPYLLVWIAFTFIYVFVPNTRVRVGTAATGGLVAGVLWQTAGWGFATFIASSARYAAIYSSFAILILLLIWLYLNWLILLLGAEIAFYSQNPRYLTMKPVRLVLSNRLKERLALGVMYLIGFNHHHNRTAWTLDTLAERLDLPTEPVHAMLRLLKEAGFLIRTGDDPPAYFPARDIGTLPLGELLTAVRRAEESRLLADHRFPVLEPVDALVERARHAVDDALAGTTLGDLVISSGDRAGTAEGGAAGRRPSAPRSV